MATAALEPVFAQMCATAGITQPFVAFLIAQKLVAAEDFALVASLEGEVKEFIAAAEAAKVKFEAWGDKTAVKKLWLN